MSSLLNTIHLDTFVMDSNFKFLNASLGMMSCCHSCFEYKEGHERIYKKCQKTFEVNTWLMHESE